MLTGAKLQTWISQQWQTRGWWAQLTRPLAWVYNLIAKRRRQSYRNGHKQPFKAPVPIIVIGNIYVGGTGKTPLACALAQILARQGWRPGLVSRGFGRQHSQLPATGKGANLDWRQFGDEPALIARKSGMPVGVHQDRGLAVQALLSRFPETNIIISDDGLQHYRLARDLEILVQDERGIGNGWLLPAGPLRESPSRLDEVDLVLTREQQLGESSKPAFSLQIDRFWQPSTNQHLSVAQFAQQIATQTPIAAVAGIGVPERFFKSLEQLGITVGQTYALADHAAIDPDWLRQLPAKTILMTEKDAIKIGQQSVDTRLWVAQTSVLWWRDDVDAFMADMLARAGIKHSEP